MAESDTRQEQGDDVARQMSADIVSVLVENHREFLRFLERRVGSRAVAEDILQEAFIRGLGKAETLRNEQSAVAWFYQLLRNALIDHARRAGAAQRAMTAVAAETEEAQAPDAELLDAVCKCVGRLAGTLKPEYADALRRVEVDGLSVASFAEEAGITANNASVRLFRARQALKKQLQVSCGTCSSHGCLECTCGEPGGGGKR
jgi:RNA polymerase sigma-70 factor (ECF subfamily)